MDTVRPRLTRAKQCLAVGCAVAVFAAMGGAAPPAQAQRSGKLSAVVGFIQEPDTLNPLVTNTNAGTVAHRPLFEPPVEYDRQWKLQPVLMENLPSLSNGQWKMLSGTRQQLTWKLRRGIRWTDGQEVTADDVVFTHEAGMNPQVPVGDSICGYRGIVESVRATDRYTVVVTFKERFALAQQCPVEASKYAILPRHVLEPILRQNPARLMEAAFGRDGRATIGNGPFVLKEWVQGSEIIYEANRNYWRGRPALNLLVFKYFSDANTLIANIVSGAVDAAGPAPIGLVFGQGLQLDDLVRQGRAPGLKVEFGPTTVTDALHLNHSIKLYQDKRIRQALAHGINREAISQELFRGKQGVAYSFLPPNHPAYLKDIKKYPYNPERARQLLGEAGWSIVGPDGIRRNAQGERLVMVVTTTAGNRDRERVEQVMQANLKDVGIDLMIKNLPSRVIYGDIYYKARYEGMVLGSHPFLPDPTFETYSKDTAEIPVGQESRNNLRYWNPEMQKLIDRYNVDPDAARRMEQVRGIEKIWAEEVPVVAMYYWTATWAYRNTFQNFKPAGTAITPTPFTWNVNEWRWTQ